MHDPKLDRDAIAARAFALYVRRGRQPGRAMEDWIEAERQLRAEQAAPALDLGTVRGSLAGQPVPPRALPEAKMPPAFAAPARPPALAATGTPAALASPPSAPAGKTAPSAQVAPAAPPTPTRPEAPKPSGGGKKRRKK